MRCKSPFPAILRKAKPYIAKDITGSDLYVEVIADAIERGLQIEVSALTLAIDICVSHLKNAQSDIDIELELELKREAVLSEIILTAEVAGLVSMPQYAAM